jgi:outer membrane protein assembly factor BamB
MPPDWQLIARDAFNGVILWKRSIPQWQTHLWPLKAGPATIPRRLVAIADRVYVTLGLTQPVMALDAATGKTLKTYEGTEGTEEMLVDDGVLYLRVNEDFKPNVFKPENEHCWTESKRAMGVIGVWKPSDKQHIAAVDAGTGRERWRVQSPVARLTLTVDADSLYFHTGQCILSFDRQTGDKRWQQDDVPKFTSLNTRTPPTLVSYDDVLLYEHQGRIMALSRQSGDVLWKTSHPRSGHVSPGDVLVINDLVWSAGRAGEKFIGKDIHTGQEKVAFLPPKMRWFHPRCYRSKGTVRYLLASRTGIELADVRKQKVDVNHWTRGACLYGIMPANGLIYTGPHSCACLLETKTSGFNALAPAPAPSSPQRDVPDADRLTKGPAYARVEQTTPSSSAWPMYRHDIARSGYTPIALATHLRPLWTADVKGKPTSLVSANNIVLTVTPTSHAVHALAADSGRTIWTYRCAGRIDSPPTLHAGKVLFGSHDGYVYCLRLTDGALVWKFLAATNEQRLVSHGQVESVWPVHGSVLALNDAVYCVAGRSAFLDGGLRLYKLDADTGQMLAVCKIDETDPRSGKNLQELQAGWCGLTMPVANPDILTSDGKCVFMRSEPFDLQTQRLRINPDLNVQQQDRQGAHLFSPVGFLDDTWHHRAYWVYGVTSVYGWHVWFEAAKHAPSGRILSFDDDTVFGFARKPQFWAQSPVIEYQMYRADKKPAPDGPARVAKAASQHPKGEWNQTQWLSRGNLHTPRELTALKYDWIKTDLPLQIRAMVLTKNALFVAGTPDVINEIDLWRKPDDPALQQKLAEQLEAWRGHRGGSLWTVSRETGDLLSRMDLEVPPVFDGMIAIDGKLLLSRLDGKVTCYAAQTGE